MKNFEQPIFRSRPDMGDKYTRELCFAFAVSVNGLYLIIPKGTLTDGATMPRIAQLIAPKYSADVDVACLVHDYLYAGKRLPRKECDKVFYELLLRYGCKKWRARLMWLAVRLFGKSAYEKGRKE